MKNLEQQICEMIVERLNLEDVNVEEIDYEAPLFSAYDEQGIGLGLDSVDSLELVVAIKEQFSITITDEDVSVFKNVTTLANFIRDKQS